MARWYMAMTVTGALMFSVLIVSIGAMGQLFDSNELAFTHCDETREHCSLNFLDVERRIIAVHPLDGEPFDLDWSPEGSRLLISELTMDGVWTYLLDRDGSIRRFQPLI